MTTVTIPGGSGSTIVFSVLGNAASNYAQDFANAVAADTNPSFLTPTGGESSVAGALNIYTGGSTSTVTLTLQVGSQYTYNASSTPDIIDIQASNETLFSGYYSTVNELGTSGGNRVEFTTGSNVFNGSSTGGTGDTIIGGSGTDTINTGGGASTVFSGVGASTVYLQDTSASAGDVAILGGPSTIYAYGASDTVFASGGGSVVGGSGNLTFVSIDPPGGSSPAAASLMGGSGTSQVFLISGSSLTYSDAGMGTATIVAGSGNETLNAAGSSSSVAVFATDSITGLTVTGGSGSDFFGSGGGMEQFTAGAGSTDFIELNGLSGSQTTIADLSSATGYAVNIAGLTVAQEQAAANGGTEAGGNLTITLGNGSTVEFMGVTASTLDSHFV